MKSKSLINTNVNEKVNSINKAYKQAQNKASFVNDKGVNKQIARDVMVNAIKQSDTTKGLILTLPFIHCLIERQILAEVSKKYSFLGCEQEPDVYNKMLMTIAKNNLPISTHKGTIGEKIRQAKANEYSHLILDYCGQLGTTHEDIRIAMLNNIVEINGTIAITLNKRITPKTEEIYELMERLNPQTDKTISRSEHCLKTLINRIGGFNYAIESTLNYHDTANMILVIVRRIA